MINLRPDARQIPDMEKLDIIGLSHSAEPHNYIGQDFAGEKGVNK